MRKILLIALLFVLRSNAQDSPIVDTASVIEERYDYDKNDVILYADTSSVQKSSFPKNFKDRYQSDEFNYKEKTKEETAWDRFIKWISDLIGRMFEMGGPQSVSAAIWVFRIISSLVVVLVIYYIVKTILNKEGNWIFGKSSAKRIFGADELEKNLQQADFETLVAETLASGDKRLAIRYYYLWLLQRLSLRGYIEWDVEKTNSDYLYEIKSEKQREDFAYLSYLYNYIWYGEFEADDATFTKAERAFKTTIKST